MKVQEYSLTGKRSKNEDEHIIFNSPTIKIFGVFDGHGGSIVSKYLKQKFQSEEIIKKIEKCLSKCNYKNQLITLFDCIQRDLEICHPRAINYCGSTACILIDNNNNLIVCNVGDSRIVACNKDNIAIPLSNDHKPMRFDEKQRIEKLGGKIIYDSGDWRIKGMSLSRAFGDIDCKPFVINTPEIYKYNNNCYRFYIIGCDGLWDILTNQEAVDFILELLLPGNYKGNISKDLVYHAYKKGSMDNITAIVIVP